MECRMSLNQYHKKRNFSKTPEPEVTINEDLHHLFVIQKHAASHLHYDFRIELHGVLKSWAIPKGPSLDPHVKRLAIQVEDHPVEYGSFEGIIPKSQYGGGTVMLWDKGMWQPLDEDPGLAYERGHIHFELLAEKLHGQWDLIRFKEKQWFLIKHQDKYTENEADYDITAALDKSILSNQTIAQLSKNYENIWGDGDQKKTVQKKARKKSLPKKTIILIPEGLSKSSMPDFIPPQLATLVDKVPESSQWLHEIKFDGYRILAYKNDKEVILKSRNNKDWTNDLASIAAAVKALPIKNIILDGEVVVLDKEGKSDFQLLQNSIKSINKSPFKYFIFDIPYFDQYDLRDMPLLERKAILKNILNPGSSTLIYNDHIIKDGQEMFEHSCHFALEGIVSKKIDSPYISKRSKDWLKIKCLKRQEFVIGGYTSPKGKRAHFGALLLGVYNKNNQLEYAGNVGTGFNAVTLNEIYQELLKNKHKSNPFISKPPGFSRVHWVLPNLVGEVEFSEWTKEGHLRHPRFKGLRLDKIAEEVVREQETPLVNICSHM